MCNEHCTDCKRAFYLYVLQVGATYKNKLAFPIFVSATPPLFPFPRPAFGNFRGDTVQSVLPTVKLCCLPTVYAILWISTQTKNNYVFRSVLFFWSVPVLSYSVLFLPMSFRSLFCSALYCVTPTSGNETFCMHLFRSNVIRRRGQGDVQ